MKENDEKLIEEANAYIKEHKRDFSSFFNRASEEEKRKLMENVARKANEDQRNLMKQYEQAERNPS